MPAPSRPRGRGTRAPGEGTARGLLGLYLLESLGLRGLVVRFCQPSARGRLKLGSEAGAVAQW